MAASSQPIMRLLEIIGQRWTLRILWELRDGPMTFRVLRARCEGVSPTVLNQRLGTLRDAGFVANEPEGYALTPMGLELGHQLLALGDWAKIWAARRKSGDAPSTDQASA